jgi:hypothetical protein
VDGQVAEGERNGESPNDCSGADEAAPQQWLGRCLLGTPGHSGPPPWAPAGANHAEPSGGQRESRLYVDAFVDVAHAAAPEEITIASAMRTQIPHAYAPRRQAVICRAV